MPLLYEDPGQFFCPSYGRAGPGFSVYIKSITEID
jgi:hypothetical protein